MSTSNLILEDLWLFCLQIIIVGLATVPAINQYKIGLTANYKINATLAVIIMLVCYFGHYFLLMNYDLSRDEQMAQFDSWVFLHHRLVWPLPVSWQPVASALNLGFMLPVQHPVAWISAYLPGNAILRAGVGTISDRALTGPLLTGLSVPLVWGCARRLWPNSDPLNLETAGVAVVLFITSGQVIISGMTAFAMPAHLFINLLWLWLFLAKNKINDVVALAVGFLGIGLHQPLFHPLFVGPWLLVLVYQREWERFAFYSLGYLAMGMFWIFWPVIMLPLVVGPHSSIDVGVGYVSRLLSVFRLGPYNFEKTGLNLFRFACWENPLLVPLLLMSARTLRQDSRLMALAMGLITLPVVMTVILPDQGHGFGYRYLHGFVGNAVLLASAGWRELRFAWPRLRNIFPAVSILTGIIMLPVQAVMAHVLYTPAATANMKIANSGADYVFVGPWDAPYAMDLVYNNPDLSNRPIRLSYLSSENFRSIIARICRPNVKIALPTDKFYKDMIYSMRYFANHPTTRAGDRLAYEQSYINSAGCKFITLN